MTLPAASRSWDPRLAATVTAAGTVSDTNKDVCVALLAAGVTRGLWTIVRSCNGTSAGSAGDGVNRWLLRSDIVRNTPTNAHSWALVTTGVGQLVVDLDNTFDGSGSVWWSEASGFSGGSTTARPTATDEVEITSTPNILHTVNGINEILTWVCTTPGREGIRIAIKNGGATAGPCHLASIEKAASTPAAWTSKITATVTAGSGTFGNRTDWTGTGWRARVGGVVVNPRAAGDTPPSTNDVDGDVLLAPCALDAIAGTGRLGFVDDFYFVTDNVAKYGTYSDASGTMGWIRLDEVVWPWDHVTAVGSNTAGAKLMVNYFPTSDSVAPTVTRVSSATPGMHDPAVFDITDISPGVKFLHVAISWPGRTDARDVVYDGRDGRFIDPWSGQLTAITNGFRLSLNAPTVDGWSRKFRIHVRVLDGAGNLESP